MVAVIPSLFALDSLNFFIAAVQTGFGAFITVHLVKSQWVPQAIGFALTVGTISTLLSQMPAGALIDSVPDKRKPVLAGIAGVGLAAVFLCVGTERFVVYTALALQGLASSLIGPGIAAISLALVGPAALSERIGRNARFASIGNGLAAGIMGIIGSYLPATSVFLLAAVLTVPALLSVLLIGRGHSETSGLVPSSANPAQAEDKITWRGLKSLLLDKRLAVFAICVVLFFAASAAIGPGIAGQVTRRRPDFATLVVAATILLPQAIVAAISPWIGRQADKSGRRPLLLAGWALLPFQGLAFATLPGPIALVICYLLNAVSGAVFGVMMTVVASDLTRRTGCFNLMLGALGVAIAIGASLSTLFAGFVAGTLGAQVAALGLGLIGLCGAILLWMGMPETRPAGEAP